MYTAGPAAGFDAAVVASGTEPITEVATQHLMLPAPFRLKALAAEPVGVLGAAGTAWPGWASGPVWNASGRTAPGQKPPTQPKTAVRYETFRPRSAGATAAPRALPHRRARSTSPSASGPEEAATKKLSGGTMSR